MYQAGESLAFVPMKREDLLVAYYRAEFTLLGAAIIELLRKKPKHG